MLGFDFSNRSDKRLTQHGTYLNNVEIEVRRVLQTFIVSSRKISSSAGNRKTVEPSANFQDFVLENVPIQQRLADQCSQIGELEMQNGPVKKQNGKLVSTPNDNRTAHMSLKRNFQRGKAQSISHFESILSCERQDPKSENSENDVEEKGRGYYQPGRAEARGALENDRSYTE